jgi:hypothetical protein
MRRDVVRAEERELTGLQYLRSVHEKLKAAEADYVPPPSAMEFFKGVDALKDAYGRDVPMSPDHVDVIRHSDRVVHIAYYAPKGRKHLQILTFWEGRVRKGVWKRDLRDDVARTELPQQIHARLAKPKKGAAAQAAA